MTRILATRLIRFCPFLYVSRWIQSGYTLEHTISTAPTALTQSNESRFSGEIRAWAWNQVARLDLLILGKAQTAVEKKSNPVTMW